MHKVKYGLFYDNHTHIDNPDVGKNFDPEYFTDEIKKCGVDYIGFHARCNQGMAYYDTKIGIRHPSLSYDLFGKVVECCRKKDIAVVAYFNGCLSMMELVDRREWQTLHMEGHGCYGRVHPFAVTACYNTPYRNHTISMIREVVSQYDVQGVFLDCLLPRPCICPTCVRLMKESGVDYQDFDSVMEFSRQSIIRFCQDVSAAVREYLPDPMLYFNGPFFGTVKDLDTFFDCECIPTCASWGYEYLPTMAHYMRNIKPGTQTFNMTGRFYEWGDFGGLRKDEDLKFDLFYGLAHGLRPNVGGHFHPRGDKDQSVFDRIRTVYRDLQRYDEWFDDAKNLADIAIVYPHDNFDLHYMPSMCSAVRMLDELKLQFDVLLADGEKPWDQYKLLILPEQVKITDLLAERIRKHISGGGAFFACGANAAEVFASEFGIKYLGDSGLDPVYFKLHETFSEGLDDMFFSVYSKAAKAECVSAKSDSRIVKPYYNLQWNGLYPIFYAPPQEETGMPFLTVNGNCVWCAGDLFTGYAQRGALHLRTIVRNVIYSLVEKPLIIPGKLPACVRMSVTEQPGRLNVNLIAYAPEKRVNVTVVEDPVAVLNASFKVFTGTRRIKSVTMAPENTPVEFTVNGDYTEIKLPIFEGFALVVLEEFSEE